MQLLWSDRRPWDVIIRTKLSCGADQGVERLEDRWMGDLGSFEDVPRVLGAALRLDALYITLRIDDDEILEPEVL